MVADIKGEDFSAGVALQVAQALATAQDAQHRHQQQIPSRKPNPASRANQADGKPSMRPEALFAPGPQQNLCFWPKNADNCAYSDGFAPSRDTSQSRDVNIGDIKAIAA